MKKAHLTIILIVILVLAAVLAAIFAFKNSGEKTTKIEFENVAINAEIADTRDEVERGLMYRESLGENQGMLFVFEQEKETSFWLKNTLIPLDMIFLNKDKEIVNIVENALPCRTEECQLYPSEAKVKYVIEVNAGFVEKNGIKVGDEAGF